MWILQWFPNWLFYAILIAGFAGLLLSRFVPAFYRSAVQAASIAAFTFGVFMSGGIYDNEAWKERVAEMEAKVEKAAQESKEANAAIDAKMESFQKAQAEKKIYIKDFITTEIVKYNESCEIPKEFIEIVNKAATK